MINIGIGVSWATKKIYNIINNIIVAFKARVSSYPNSIFEAEPCLVTTLAELNSIGLLDSASLIITPNAYSEGKLYDVVPNTTLGDMDVVRATTATRVNEQGLIEIVPRNLFTYSEEFDNISWIKTQSTITPNTIAAPNGTITADTFEGTGANSFHLVFRGSTPTIGSSYTFTVYAKKNTNNFIQLSGNSSYGSNAYANFDLLNGVLGTVGSGATASILNVGNGWYRCILNLNAVNIFANNNIALITSATSVRIETNTLTTSVYIWGAQIEQGSTATTYFPTTDRLNIPRIDYSNGSCPSLLVEPQRTNLLTYSNDFSNAYWAIDNVSLTTGFISPDGTNNAFKLTESATNNSHSIFINNGINSSSGIYTISIYIKKGERFKVAIADRNQGSNYVSFNLNNQTIIESNGLSGNIELLNNDWYRLSVTNLSNITFFVPQFFILEDSYTTGIPILLPYLGNGTSSIYIYGAQVELGSYVTSFIPTVNTTVTRNADVISKTGISSLIGQTEGVIYFENIVNFKNVTSGVALQGLSNSIDTNFINLYVINSSDIYMDLSVAGVYVTTAFLGNISSLNLGDTYKIAIQYNSFGVKTYKNGVFIQTSNSFIFNNFSNLYFKHSYADSYINNKSTILFKNYLTDAECIALTTL